MAPAFAIPRLLARHNLAYGDVHLWEIHEAFAAQVAFHLKDPVFLRDKAKGSRAIVSICADSGQGNVLLLEAA